ncbi:MAG: hypothetical protein ACO1OB_08830 [Archangium sp.]
MKRTSSLVAALFAAVALAQNQRPLPREAPQTFIATAPRVHVIAHESLEVDRLRELARPNVTLWLRTDSNTLKKSTVENLQRFDSVWVQLRAPLKPVDAAVFARIPKAGAWLDSGSLSLVGRLPGARRVAVKVEGEPDFDALRKARPAEVRWAPTSSLDLLSWSQFRSLPGRRVLAPAPGALLPVSCAERTSADPSVELHVASLLSLSSDVFPCGAGARVVIQPGAEPWLLQSLLVRDPSAELILDVGADGKRAVGAREVLERLQVGPGR